MMVIISDDPLITLIMIVIMIHRDTTISNNIDNDSNDDGDHM